jgi:hypothetical protein
LPRAALLVIAAGLLARVRAAELEGLAYGRRRPATGSGRRRHASAALGSAVLVL